MQERNGLEWTFDTEVEKYDKMRPGYGRRLYEAVFSYCPIGRESRVLEVGIGSGQATEPFLRTGCRLTAVEYGERFSELCRGKFREFPGFDVVTGRFEEYVGELESLDLIYSATAFHWIPEELGYSKVFALLKSGGAFARFANHPCGDLERKELWEELQRLYRIYMPDSKVPQVFEEAQAEEIARIPSRYGFTDIEWRVYERTREFTAGEYTALLGTYSDHIALPESVRRKFFSEIETAIGDFGGRITIHDRIDLELARKP